MTQGVSCSQSRWKGRACHVIENDRLKVVFLEGGGHVAELSAKAVDVNPLWEPIWEGIDPENYDAARHEASEIIG